MNRTIASLFLSLVLFAFALCPSPLSAQQTDTALRLSGAGADSITGGIPTVMIRRAVKADARLPFRHAIEIDPIKAGLITNITYHHMLTPALSVGGTVQFSPGVFGTEDGKEGWGLASEVNLFPFGDGPKGPHLVGGAHFYSGMVFDETQDSVTYEYIEIERSYKAFSLTGAVGWRLPLNHFHFTFQVGVSSFLKPIALGAAKSIAFVAYDSRERGIKPHANLRIGYQW